MASVTSDTALTLSRAFTGTTASGQTATYDHSPKEGSYYTVTDNGTNTLTVNLNGDSLTAVAAGTTVSLIPYWKLGGATAAAGAAFPDSDAGTSYIVSTGTTTRTRQTQILMPDLVDAGVNLSTSATYFYYNGWTDGTNSANDVILPPTTYFIVRNPATATTFTPTGNVYMNRITAVLDTQAAAGQDNAVALSRPASTTLNDLDLVSSGAFVSSTGTTTRTRGDSLLVYDNTVTGYNKASSNTYYYYNGGWRTGNDGTTDLGSTVTIPYGTGFLIRKAAATGAVTSFWQNTRNY